MLSLNFSVVVHLVSVVLHVYGFVVLANLFVICVVRTLPKSQLMVRNRFLYFWPFKKIFFFLLATFLSFLESRVLKLAYFAK